MIDTAAVWLPQDQFWANTKITRVVFSQNTLLDQEISSIFLTLSESGFIWMSLTCGH